MTFSGNLKDVCKTSPARPDIYIFIYLYIYMSRWYIWIHKDPGVGPVYPDDHSLWQSRKECQDHMDSSWISHGQHGIFYDVKLAILHLTLKTFFKAKISFYFTYNKLVLFLGCKCNIGPLDPYIFSISPSLFSMMVKNTYFQRWYH